MEYQSSAFQEQLWLHDAFERKRLSAYGADYYNIPIIFRINGIVHEHEIREALTRLLEKHEALRTSLLMSNGAVTQHIREQAEPVLITLDWSGENRTEIEALAVLKELNAQAFLDGLEAPLVKSVFLPLNREISYLLLTIHRAICDERSVKILKRDFIRRFTAYANDEQPDDAAELPLQYADFSEWQHELPDEILETHLMYWKRKLNKELRPIVLPMQRKKTEAPAYQPAEYRLVFQPELMEKVERLRIQAGLEKRIIFLTVLKILLLKFTGEKEIHIGTTVSEGMSEELLDTVGPISNPLILHDELYDSKPFLDIARQIAQTCQEAKDHSIIPFERIAKEMKLRNSGDAAPLFDILFHYWDADEDMPVSRIQVIESNIGWGKADYHVLVQEEESETRLYVTYDSCCYSGQQAAQLAHSFMTLCEALCGDPDQPVLHAEFIDEDEKNLLLSQWTNTNVEAMTEECVHHLFSRQALKTPDHIAVQYDEQTMTYGELEESSNQIANWLKRHGIESEDIIAIVMDRNIHTVELMLGILKAGACYLTIEPDAPVERRRYILEDSRPKLVIVEERYADAAHGEQAVILESLLQNKAGEPKEVTSPCHHANLAYVIYTSGTTGKPKGVLLEHRNLARIVCHSQHLFDYTADDVWSMSHPYSFDFSVWEMYCALLTGGRVVIVPRSVVKDTARFRHYLSEYGVTVLCQTPTACNALIHEEIKHPGADLKVRTIIFGGEALSVGDLRELREKYPEMTFVNSYGITETTILATFKKVTDEEIASHVNSIGVPLPNYQVYVLNSRQQIVPIGVEGELYVGGSGVARAYLNRPELTQEKFVPNPFGEGRLYRSGDLARWKPNGELEYIGRIDDQVKIRGYRMELGEIETILKRQPGIRNAAVMAREKAGESCLCAYLVSDHSIGLSALRSALAEHLPEYMIPAYMQQIGEIPMTVNGKVDKKALPEIEASSEMEYVPPGTYIEKSFARIFEEVLDVERIGIYDNFFEAGGHSLKATKVINRIEEVTGIRLSLIEMLKEPTVEALSRKIKNKEKPYVQIPKAESKPCYPMSSSQKRIFVISSMDNTGVVYNMYKGMEINGKLDVSKVKHAYLQLVSRHEILRTGFFMKDGEAVQQVLDEVSAEIEYDEAEEVGEADKIRLLSEFVRPFDLGKAPLLRIKVIRVGQGNDLLFFDMHHIISDGMSINILAEDFTRLYSGETLEEPGIQYKDYSEWMRTRDLSGQRAYWIHEFKDSVPVLHLPLDYKRPPIQSFLGNSVECFVDQELKTKVMALCRKTGTTEYMVLLSILMVLLSKYSRQEDIVVGSPISGRTHRDTENILGMFVNTMALRGKPEADKTFGSFLNEMKDTCLHAQENQEYPFDELVEEVEVNRDLSRNPLFDVLFSLENPADDVELDLDGFQFKEIFIEHAIAKFDLTVTVSNRDTGYGVTFEYGRELFAESSIRQMMAHFCKILKEVTFDPEQRIAELEVLEEEEQARILGAFNNTDAAMPQEKSVAQLFNEQAAKVPDHIAVSCEDQALTYRELSRKANRLAAQLRKLGVRRDDYVAVMAERRIETIVAICGIVQAGGAYVPIDPANPGERIEYILKDCKPKAMLAYDADDRAGVPVINLSEADPWEAAEEEPVSRPNDLIYVIYTSGTTGRPKGVMVEHKNVIRLVKNAGYAKLDERTVILQTGALSFDASTFEIWGALLNGGHVHLADRDVILDARRLKGVIQEKSITTMFTTTALFNQLMSTDETVFDGLGTLLFGGEKTSEMHVRKLVERNRRIDFANIYGPTETTTFAVWYPIEERTLRAKTPIGKPISNTRAYVVNEGKLCGIGMIGELCIAGDGVARGYLNLPEQTAEKFVANPFGEGRMYRTGDLVRWLPDGNLEYVGRMDEQIKLRGFRIELGEIESALRKLSGVRDAVVTVHEEREEKHLCAYLVAEEADVSISRIREELRKELPEYMIPVYMMTIGSIPVNRNGKIDKKALSPIEIKSERAYAAPRNETERAIVQVFEDILGIDQVGMRDSFYELGGDSIKAIRIISRLRELNFELTVKEMLQLQVIEDMISRVRKDADRVEYEQGEVTGEVPLTPIQHLFFQWNLKKPDHFNQAVTLQSRDRLEEEALREALRALAAHHDLLRAVFTDGRQEIRKVDGSCLFHLESFDYSGIMDESLLESAMFEQSTAIQRSMDLSKGPLLRTALYRAPAYDYLMICIHHLVVDGISWRILLEDLVAGYFQARRGTPILFPGKTASYLDWSKALLAYSESGELKREIQYWEGIHAQMNTGIIEADADGTEQGYESLTFEFGEELTSQLLYEAGKAFNTAINDILLSALGMAVNSWKRQNKVAIYLEGHGREEINQAIDIHRTVGWFTSIYPVILEASEKMEDVIVQTKEMLRHIPNRGMGYGVIRYGGKYEIPETVPDIGFNYLGQWNMESNEGTGITASTLSSGVNIAEENQRTNSISLNGSIYNGKLAMTIEYDKSKFSHSSIQTLNMDYQKALTNVVQFCISRKETVKTASDYHEELTDDVLKDIINSF